MLNFNFYWVIRLITKKSHQLTEFGGLNPVSLAFLGGIYQFQQTRSHVGDWPHTHTWLINEPFSNLPPYFFLARTLDTKKTDREQRDTKRHRDRQRENKYVMWEG